MRRAEAEAFEAMQFGDLDVLAHLPAKMLKALAVIADRAHPAYDECSGVAAGASKDKCLFMSLAVRDFLVEIGYRDYLRAGVPITLLTLAVGWAWLTWVS